jgi:proteasome accessory factor C
MAGPTKHAPELARVQRLIALASDLRENNGETVDATAAHFAITPAELVADLNALMLCGVPPYLPHDYISIEVDDDNCIEIRFADYFARPLRLTPPEQWSLAALLSVSVPPDSAVAPLLAKLRSRFAETGGDPDLIENFRLYPPRPGDVDLVAALDIAIAQKTPVEIEYTASYRGTPERRRVYPHRMELIAGVAHLVAYCTLRDGWRQFRIDRIASASPSTGTIPVDLPAQDVGEPRAGQKARVYVLDQNVQAFLDEIPTAKRITRRGTRHLIEFPFHSDDWLVWFCAARGDQLTLASPRGLVDRIRARWQQVLKGLIAKT